MQVDFYHLTRDPAEKLVPALAEKCLSAGQKLLLVSQDEERRKSFSQALWKGSATSFLAHDYAGSDAEADQPILISDNCKTANGARYVMLSDGQWRDQALDFDRAFFLFTADEIEAARSAWRSLSEKEDVEPRYWKQDGGRWVEGP